MYEKDGDFGKSRHGYTQIKTEWPQLIDHISMSGYHLCNDKYIITRNPSKARPYLLMITVDGEGELMIEDRHYMLRPGMLAVVPMKNQHAYYTRPDGLWEFYWLHVEGDQSEKVLDYIINVYGNVIEINEYKEMIGHFCDITETDRTGTPFELYAFEKINRIYSILLRNSLNQIHDLCTPNSLFNRINEYIDNHYMENISVRDIARNTYITSEHVIRVFKKETGVTPYQYIKKMRLTYAKKLLLLSNLPVSEIAREVGYSSASAFCALFREEFGITPAVFRSMMLRN